MKKIANVSFIEKRKTLNKQVVEYHRDYKNIYSVYGRPSSTKVDIYNEWLDFFKNNTNLKMYGVDTYSHFVFTLNVYFEYEGKKYFAHITPAKNEIYNVMS